LKALARFPTRHPWIVLLVTLALTGAFGYGLTRTTIVNDIKQFLPSAHPERLYYDEVETLFGNTDLILIGLEADDVFTAPVLAQLVRLTRALEASPGIEEVQSLANIDNIVGEAGTLEVAKLMPDYEVPDSDEGLAALKAAATSWEMYTGALISRSGQQTCVVARAKEESHYAAVYEEVLRIVEAERQQGPCTLYLSGVEPIFALTDQWVLADVHARTVTLYVLTTMAVVVGLARITNGQPFAPISLPGWQAILSLAVVTALSRLLMFAGLRRLGGAQTALLSITEVLTTLLVALLMLGERLSLMQWIGAVILLTSVVLVRRDQK